MSVIALDTAAFRWLKRTFETQKIPHAMMIVADQAIDAAKEIAASIVCDNHTFPSCHTCAHCYKNDKGIHPDVIIISGKATIQVDQIREMRLDAFVLPNDCHRKVYIIDQAQTMTESAQNAFLKILEQPPAGVYFILAVTHRRGIIDTIHSRVVEISLKEKQILVVTDKMVQDLWDACLKKDELEISCTIEKGFSSDRNKAMHFVGQFSALMNQKAITTQLDCMKALSLYEAARMVLSRLENGGNVNLCAAYFSILCLEAVF